MTRRSLILTCLSARAFCQTAPGLRTFGNRREGLIYLGTGSTPGIDVIGFHGLYEGYRAQETLFVNFFPPFDGDVTVRAREIEVLRQYWMESFPQAARGMSWARFGPWPAGDVLAPEQIPAENIAVTVSSKTGLILPAFVYARTDRLPRRAESYTLIARADKSADKLQVELSDADGRLLPAGRAGKNDTRVIAGVPFPVELDFRALPDGQYRIVLKGWAKTDRPPDPIIFYHRAVVV